MYATQKMFRVFMVAGLIAAPALSHADSVNVNIYGKIRVGIESVNDVTADSSKGSSMRVVDNASRIGFKGSEDLGDGLYGFWQVESGLQADGDVNKGVETDGRLNSRNTFLGLRGDNWGSVVIGKNDTPYKSLRDYIDPMADSTAEASALLHKSPSAAQNFHTRQTSTVQYSSPNWSGFEFKLGLAPDEVKTSNTKKTRISTAFTYKADKDAEIPFTVGLAYENRASQNAANEKATALKLLGGLTLPSKTELGLAFEQIKLGTMKRNAMFFAVKQNIDAFSVSATIGKANESSSDAKDGATHFSLGGAYKLSKRTELSAYYSKITNQSAGKYNFGANALDGIAAGKDPQVFGLMVAHNF